MTADAVRAQALRRRITIQRKVSSRDVYGGETITYAQRATLHAEIKPVSAREPLLAQQYQAGEQYEFTVRHRTDIELTDRVLWRSKAYDVIGLVELGRNARLKIIAKRPESAA